MYSRCWEIKQKINLHKNEVAAIQVIGVVIMVITIAAFASVVSFGFEPGQAAPAVIFNEKDLDSNKLQLITSSEPVYWDDLDFQIEPSQLSITLPSGNVLAGQTIDCPPEKCTITVIHDPSNAVIGVYEFDGPIYVSDESDGQDGSDDTDESDDSDDSDGLEDSEGPIEFSIFKITPKTLNSKSSGRWITLHIRLPESYDAAEVDISTFLLNNIVPADDRTPVSPYSDDESSELIIKFDRQDVIAVLSPGDNVELSITGNMMNDGAKLEGTAYIRVI